VSLTLTPMMAAPCFKHTPPEKQASSSAGPAKLFDYVIAQYGKALEVVLDHQPITIDRLLSTLVGRCCFFESLESSPVFLHADTSLSRGSQSQHRQHERHEEDDHS